MDYSIIIESNQEIAKKNYAVDYGTAINSDTYNDEFSNNKWKIKLPRSIKLEVGDKIQYYQSMIKTKGVSNEGVELIGSVSNNQNLTDNAGKMQFGYYIYNNWLNNAMLPLGNSSLRPSIANVLGSSNFEYRNFNYQDTKHKYNVADDTDTNIPRVWWSDYGAPSIETITDWIDNGASSLYNNANELSLSKFGKTNTNTTATNNLCHYTPDTQRLYIGSQDWIGPYSNGYSSYHNQNLTGTYSKKYDIVKSDAEFQTDTGFNSPIVIGNKITESLNNPNLQGNDEFVNPRTFDYTDDLKTDTSLTDYKGYFNSVSNLQIEDESCKCFPSTFGKMVYDLQNGVDNFSINTTLETKTSIALPTSAQKIKYFWNCIASGDYKRTMASSELFSNLNLSKNINTLNVNNLVNTSFYSGNASPETNYPSLAISTNAAYPSSAPYDLGEQMCIYDDLDGFSANFTTNDLEQKINNIIFRSDTLTDYTNIKKLTTNDKYLNLQNNNVLMTNMVANDDNFDKLKKVFDLLEKPSVDMKVDYSNQEFKDSLYGSFEIGALDDEYSQSIFQLDSSCKTIDTGIPLPVALPCVKAVADKLEGGDISALSYIEYKKRARIPIMAGLFCDDDNIIEKKDSSYEYTLLNEFRDNKMYEVDFHTRYNDTRIPKNGNCILPSSSNFSFTDSNGDYYDNNKIKDNDLGVVVAYRNLIDTSDEVIEFGLGSQPSASQFSMYSVDTTNNYAVNSSNFVNVSSNSDLTKFGDNSVQTLNTNNTIYLSQNSTNLFSEVNSKVDISSTNAMAIEYDAPELFIPSKMEIFQQASFPNTSLPSENLISTPLAGANGTELYTGYGLYGNNATDVITGTGGSAGSVGEFHNNNTKADEISNNDITADVAINLANSTTPVGISYDFTTPQIVSKYRIWMHDASSSALQKTPKNWEFRASLIDKSTYNSNNSSTYIVLDSQNNVTSYPFITGNGNTASNNLNLANEYNLSTIGSYKYYVLHITSTNGSNLFSISEFALYGDKPKIKPLAGAGGTEIFSTYISPTIASENNVSVISNNSFANRYVFQSPRINVFAAYDFALPQVVNKYIIWGYPGNAGFAPKIWEFRASKINRLSYNENDPSTYDVLDSQNNPTFNIFTSVGLPSDKLAGGMMGQFINDKPYTYYVLHIINNGGNGGVTTLYQLALYGNDNVISEAGAGVTTGFTASSSPAYGSYSLTGAYDNVIKIPINVTNGSVLTGTSNIFWGYEFDTPKEITKYRIWGRGLSSRLDQNPKNWEIRAAVDSATYNASNSATYNVIDTRINQVFSSYNADTSANTSPLLGNEYKISTIGAYRYYVLYVNSNNGNSEATAVQEFALYSDFLENDTISRMPKKMILQGQKLNDNVWTTIEENSLSAEPTAAGFTAPNNFPLNPTLSTLTAPYNEIFNQSNQLYKKVRIVIPEAFTNNGINIGEWVLKKKNHIKTYLGNNQNSFNASKLTFNVVNTTRTINNDYPTDANGFVNLDPTTNISSLQDGNTHSYSRLSMNTTASYSTSSNVINFGTRFMKISYELPEPSPINNFLSWATNVALLLPNLMKNVEIQGKYKDNTIAKYDILYEAALSSTTPTILTQQSINSESPYSSDASLNFNKINKKYDDIIIIIKSNYETTSNFVVLADILFSGYTDTSLFKQTPFIGITCRNQISSANKYKIPKPIEGEIFGIPKSLQNNSLSFINSWERKVKEDDRGVLVADISVENEPVILGTPSATNAVTAVIIGGSPSVNATVSVNHTVGSGGTIVTITGIEITNNGSHFKQTPTIQFYLDGTLIASNSNNWIVRPEIEITMGTFKTSYEAGTLVNNQSQFPYIMIGSNDINMTFDTTQSRMSLSKMHTLLKEGQESNNMQRYYDASMIFNSDKPLIVPDGEAGNDVMKIHNKKTYCNSTRASFTEAKPVDNFNKQIIPISNPAIKQKGIASGLSGIGLLKLYAKNKDGGYNEIKSDNEHTYSGTILDKLGFDIKQLLPTFGNQNVVFNRGLYNKNIKDNDKPLSQYKQQVSPLTTNGFISSALNQSLNTNNINYIVGSIDGNNLLEKSLPQESDSLIASNLASKFSYSHLLLYSNIIPKYNYIASESINKTNCVGNISRSYETGDIIYGNQPGIPYIVDKNYILTDIDVDLRTEQGIPAPINSGSTVVFKIDKRKHIPLELQTK